MQRIVNTKLENQTTNDLKPALDPTISKQEPNNEATETKVIWSEVTQAKVGNYLITELLGRGSYATVYLAKSLKNDNKEVAIKIFEGSKKGRGVKDEINILK